MSAYTEGYREKARRDFDGTCDHCGDPVAWDDVEVHHVDRRKGNDNRDNLARLCHECHVAAHHGSDPLWKVVCSLPAPVVEVLDEAVEDHGFHSRSEAVARAVVAAYSSDTDYFGGPAESVSAWYSDDRHTQWVSDLVLPPGGEGR